jgi:hypothetical protein
MEVKETRYFGYKFSTQDRVLIQNVCVQIWNQYIGIIIKVFHCVKIIMTSDTSIYCYYLLTYGAEPFLRSRQLCNHSRTSQHFMEPEGSSPCSQEPSNGPYPEPDQPSPHHPILSLIYCYNNNNNNNNNLLLLLLLVVVVVVVVVVILIYLYDYLFVVNSRTLSVTQTIQRWYEFRS